MDHLQAADLPAGKCLRRYSLPSQQHMYMETQCSVADPDENGGMVIQSSTQTLDGVQSAVARALGIPCHAVTASESPADQLPLICL